MNKVIVAIGSNYDSKPRIETAKKSLQRLIHNAGFTSEKETAPIGVSMPCAYYTNLLAYGYTDISIDSLREHLKAIEKACGDKREERRKGMVAMDLDILLYGNNRHHEADWQRDYIKEMIHSIHHFLQDVNNIKQQ